MSREAAHPDSPGPCVLVVEDEVGTQDALSTLLELDGWVVVRAYDGEEALEYLQKVVPDVILTDYMMPNVDGLVLMDRISRDHRLAAVPVVLVSATNIAPELRPHARAFLKKPVNLAALRKVLTTLAADGRIDGAPRG